MSVINWTYGVGSQNEADFGPIRNWTVLGPSVTANTAALFSYEHPTGNIIIGQLVDGTVVASLGLGPAARSAAAAADIVAVYVFPRPLGDIVIYELGDGTLKIGKGVS